MIIPLTGYDFQLTYVQEIEEPTSTGNVETLRIKAKKDGVLPGFKAASKSELQPERYILNYDLSYRHLNFFYQ